jgi:hypothetical protein
MTRRILFLLAVALLLFPADANGAVTLLASHREVVTFGSLAIEGDDTGHLRVDRDVSDAFGPYDGFISTHLDSEGTAVASFARQTSTVGAGQFSLVGDFAAQGEVGATGIMAEGFGVSQAYIDFEVDVPTAVEIDGSLAASGNGTASVDLTGAAILVFRHLVEDGSLPVRESRLLQPGIYRVGVKTGGYGRQFEGHPVSPAAGDFSITVRFDGATAGTGDPAAGRFALAQNRPNPLAGPTTIGFELPSAAPVRLEVFDLHGRLVRVLAAGEFAPGSHAETWDRTDAHGARVPAGVYLYRLTAGPHRAQKKMAVLGD